MRAEQPGIAYQSVKVGSALGYWPIAGFLSTAYRLASFRVSRAGAVFGATILFYLV
ncbi:hypothetical protein [Devosia sediminis]|uniref:Uncharacterized protein n=1 Tax=Devosia sediminis TaxID=2798801 RepID=A0A934ISR1_9HYPH|nr:hypothetical protein [Devosia sediminis]MBJ3784476.1 hypothetical protein [Devosia sediminis]